jgi:dUTP pyrophosphatase
MTGCQRRGVHLKVSVRSDKVSPKVRILFQAVGPDSKIPTRAHSTDAGYDCYAYETVIVRPGETTRVRLGFRTAIPDGYFARLTSRSSTQFFVREGLIDSGYRGEWLIPVQNVSRQDLCISAGDRIGQIILQEVVDVDWVEVGELPESERGTAGFGSTGR